MTETKQYNLLDPDLIPKTELIYILKQRYIKKDSLEILDKEELVELYNQYVLPLPQRKYRVNRRGQQMTKKQIVAAKKRRLESTDSQSEDEPKTKRRSTGNLVTSFDLPSSGSGDRLKPPPSCINFEKKKIKLNSSSKSSSETVSSSLDRLKIINIDSVKDENTSNKKIKLSSSINSTSDISSSSIERSENKTSLQNHAMENVDSTVKEKKKKISKIAWP